MLFTILLLSLFKLSPILQAGQLIKFLSTWTPPIDSLSPQETVYYLILSYQFSFQPSPSTLRIKPRLDPYRTISVLLRVVIFIIPLEAHQWQDMLFTIKLQLCKSHQFEKVLRLAVDLYQHCYWEVKMNQTKTIQKLSKKYLELK